MTYDPEYATSRAMRGKRTAPIDDSQLIKGSTHLACGKPMGGIWAAYCACPDCAPNNTAFINAIFGTTPKP